MPEADKFAHELQTGDRCAPHEFVVSRDLNQQYLFAQEDFRPRYLCTAEGPGEVHPALLLSLSSNTKSPSFRLAQGTGSIQAQETAEFHTPARVGQQLRAEYLVTETYKKRGRDYQIMEVTVSGPSGTLVLRRWIHLTFPRHA